MLINTIAMLGAGLILGGIGLFAFSMWKRTEWKEAKDYATASDKPFDVEAPSLRIALACTLLFGGIVLSQITNVFYYQPAGYSALVQYLNGSQVAEMTPGVKFRWFGDVEQFKKVITVDVSNNKDTGFSGKASAVDVQFNDTVEGVAEMTARFRLPDDPENFRKLALTFRYQDNLVNSALIPLVKESLRNTATLFTAQEIVSGKRGDFNFHAQDQLENGIYLLDINEKKSLTDNDIAQAADGQVAAVSLDQKVIREVSIRKRDGEPVRKSHPITAYGLLIDQAVVQKVDPDQEFKQRLEQQREAAAQVITNRQKAKAAEEEKALIIAKGEAEKAARQVELDKLQIEKVTAAETERKVAEQQEEQAKVELRTAKLQAEAKERGADAEAYTQREIAAANDNLQQRLDALVQINQVYANAIRGSKIVPDVVIGGKDGETPNGMALVELLTAKAARDLGVDLNKTK